MTTKVTDSSERTPDPEGRELAQSNSNIDEIVAKLYEDSVDAYHAFMGTYTDAVADEEAPDKLIETAKQAIQQELLKARIDELELNAYYSQGKKTDPLELCGISKNADEVNERIADLQAKLKENSDE